MQPNRRAILWGLGAGLLAPPLQARGRRTATLPRLSPADFHVVVDAIDSPEGIGALPGGGVAFSTNAAAIGLWRPGAGTSLLGKPGGTGGVAVDRQGRALLASVGLLHNQPGPLRRIDLTTGASEVLVGTVEGRELVASNCPTAASDGVVYCSHSGWSLGNIGTTSTEGFIYACWPDGRVAVVARNLRGPNGLCLSPDEGRLYCGLTAEGRVMSWRRRPDGTLDQPCYEGPVLGMVKADHLASEIRALSPAERNRTGYCDGLAFDAQGNLWVTLPFANRVVAITPDGRLVEVVNDPAGTMIDMPTNLAFSGGLVLIVARGSSRIVAAKLA